MIDGAIANSARLIEKLKQVRAGILHDLLSYGLDHNAQLRSGKAITEHFKDSPAGRIPEKWDAQALASLCVHIGSGVTPRGGQDVYTRSGIIFIRSQNVTLDGLRLDDIAFIPEQIHLGMARSEVFAHDVLFNITGASIGRCCAVPAGLGRANVNQHVCILRVPKAVEADALLLAAILSSPIGQRQLEALNTHGNRQGLNYQQLGTFVVPWPQPWERELMAARLQASANALRAEYLEQSKLDRIKAGLVGDLITTPDVDALTLAPVRVEED